MMYFKKYLLPALGAIVLIFALYGTLTRGRPAQQVLDIPPAHSPYEHRIGGVGLVEPQSQNIQIGTQLPGVVIKVYVTAGDKVESGQPLFALDDRQVLAEIEVAKASFNTQHVTERKAEKDLSLYDKIKDSKAISTEEYTQKRFEVDRAKAATRQALAEIERLNVSVDLLTIRAPIGGTIFKVNIRPGEYAQSGSSATPLLLMGDTNIMNVRVGIDEQGFFRLSQQKTATGYLRGRSEIPIRLNFVCVEPYAVPKKILTGRNERIDTQIVEIIYTFDNGIVKSLSGQEMDVYIEAKE